jgi:hypothetical protein
VTQAPTGLRLAAEAAALTLLVAAIGAMDTVTGYELNFFVFYFVPVSLAAWRLGRTAATVTALLSASVWALADTATGHVYSSHFFAAWNTLVRLCSFLAIGWTVCRIRDLLVHMEVYIQQHSAARFSHGYCDHCARKALEEAGLARPGGTA